MLVLYSEKSLATHQSLLFKSKRAQDFLLQCILVVELFDLIRCERLSHRLDNWIQLFSESRRKVLILELQKRLLFPNHYSISVMINFFFKNLFHRRLISSDPISHELFLYLLLQS